MKRAVGVDASLEDMLSILQDPGVASLKARFITKRRSADPSVQDCARLTSALRGCSSLRSLALVDFPESVLLAVAEALEEGTSIQVLTLAGHTRGVGCKLKVEGSGVDLAHCGWYLEERHERGLVKDRYRHDSGAAVQFIRGAWTLMVGPTETFVSAAGASATDPPEGFWSRADGRRCLVKVYYESWGVESVVGALARGRTSARSLRLRGWYSLSPYSAELLGQCRSLTSLTLTGRHCRSEVFEALRLNTTLKSLIVCADHMCRDCGVQLLQSDRAACNAEVLRMLRENAALRRITLTCKSASERSLPPAMLNQIEDALRHNITLKRLKLGGAAHPGIGGLIRRNRGLPPQWRAFLSIARASDDGDLGDLRASDFRRQCGDASCSDLRALAFRKQLFESLLPSRLPCLAPRQ